MSDQATRKTTGADALLRKVLPMLQERADRLGASATAAVDGGGKVYKDRPGHQACAEYGQAERDTLNLIREIKDWLGIL